MKKRLLAILLALALVVSLMPVGVLAAPSEGNPSNDYTYATSTEVTKYPAGFFVINPNLVKSEDLEQGEGYPVGYYFPNNGDTVTLGTDTNHKVDNTTGYIGYVTETGKEYYDEQGTDRVVIDGTNFVKGTHYIMPQDFGQIKELYGEDAVIVPYQINNHTLGVKWPDVTEKDPDDGSYASKPAYHIDCYIKNVKVNVIYDANYENGGQYIHEDGATTGESYTVLGNDGTGENQNFKRDGYTFTGWNTEANGTGDWYLSAEHGNNATINPVTSGIVLYAQWEEDDTQTKTISYTVEYYKDRVKVDNDTQTVTKTVWVNDDSTTLEVKKDEINTTNMYEGYAFDYTDPSTIPETIANGGVIKVYYVKDNDATKELSYTVEYRVDSTTGELLASENVKVNVWVNDTTYIVNSVLEKTFSGYKLADSGSTTLPASVSNGETIYVIYVKDDKQTQETSYTVKYTIEGAEQANDTVVVKGTAWVGDKDPQIAIAEGGIPAPADKYNGYKLDPQNPAYPEAGTQVDSGTVYTVNYVKDENQTKYLSYTVQYYKDGELAETDTFTESVWVNDTEVPVDEEKINTTDKYEGYSFEKTVPDELPETIEANGVIKVYYTKDPVYTVSIAPADIVAYTGGKAYGAIVGEDGKESDVTASGLPRPGYHIELSADVVNWFTEHGVASTDPDEAAQDLSQYITFTYDDGNGTIREWTLTYRGIHDIDEITGEPTRYVYTLNATGNAPDVRLQYKDGDEYVFTDDFDMDENTVKAEYEMSIYPGDLNQNLIKAVIKVGEESIEATTKVGTGELKVLSATDEQYTNPLINPETGKISAAVPAGEDVTFTVNDSQVELDDNQVSLLVDSVSDSAEFNAQLEEHAANAAGMEGAETESFYLDLVHAENGNVQVGLNGTLTINWPMPSDANPEGDFKIGHYIAMDRNDTFAVDDLTGDDYHTNEVIENDDGTLSFNVGGFSPFVLVYEAKETAVTIDKSASDYRPEVGDRVKYTLVVRNTGNTTTDITVSDTLWKAGMTVYVDGNEMTLDQNGKLNIENVIAGAKITITYYYTPTWRDVGRLVNEATVTAGEVTDSDTATVIVDDGWTPNIPDDDDEDVEPEVEYTPNWLNTEDHFAYIVGYEDGSARPTANITRAEVATIFFRLLTDEARAEFWSSENDFTDVASDAWYNNAVSTLSGMGILGGYEDGSFRPNASITRAEFVAIATRFFDYSARYEGGFTDVSYGDWYADCVQASADMGLVNGYEDGSFRPNASITRAEACAIVNRVLHRIPHENHLLSESVMNVWPDNPKSAWYYADMQESTNSHDYDWTRESGSVVEDWTDKLPERDWSALETEWANAYSK